jgi:hypothetical protein
MENFGWGWTLLFTSEKGWWNYKEVLLNNEKKPSILNNYSILEKADLIKNIKKWKFQYRIDAKKFWENWGIWEVPENYSFVSFNKNQTEINLIEKFWNWKYYTFGLEKRMPYICKSNFALLTTSVNCSSKWFWTLVSANKSFSPSPWIHNLEKNPWTIWYWVK